MATYTTPWDPLHKAMLCAMLESVGQVEASHELAGRPLLADVLCLPDHELDDKLVRKLGLLGDIVAKGPCLFEPYSTNPRDMHLASAIEKARRLDQQLERAYQRARKRGEPAQRRRGRVWVISPGKPAAAMRRFGCVQAAGWPRGVFMSAPGQALAVIALIALPRRRETLLLRLLGRDRILREALEDLDGLPADAVERRVAVLLATHLESSPDPETAMRAQEILEQRDAEQRQKLLTRLYELRLGRALSATEQATLTRLVEANDEEVLRVVVDPATDDLAAWLAERT